MKMTFRWYGSKADPIPLRYIKQIPGMTGLMGLLDKPAGAVWEEDEVRALVHEVHEAGLELEVIDGNDRAIALYKKFGFEIVATRPDAMRLKDGRYLDEHIMIKRLPR